MKNIVLTTQIFVLGDKRGTKCFSNSISLQIFGTIVKIIEVIITIVEIFSRSQSPVHYTEQMFLSLSPCIS